MAKGTHNKTHKRNQGIIRRLLQDKVYTPRTNAAHERLLKRTAGQGDDSLIMRKKIHFVIQMILKRSILRHLNQFILIEEV